jgi:2-amino-4-hydroxy-6-hydroxymethyldihydropteridine diphosphokinase
MKYFLGLGSNIGDRIKNLKRAIELLKERNVEIIKSSSIYCTQPVDYLNQRWFYNLAIEVITELKPLQLLKSIKIIEREMGRKYYVEKGPRIIDIDILLAENMVVNTSKLKIPHPRMHLRNFVLIPLAEISPDAFHPVLKEKVKELLAKSKDNSTVEKISTQF